MDEKIGGRRVPTEKIPVREAVGRILAADQFSKVDLPPFDKSAMDGYAVLEGDQHSRLRIEGVVTAGDPGTDKLLPGTTVKVMTGAPVPPGTARVVIVEEAVEEDGHVRFENPSPASNICKKAEDVAVGDRILKAGVRLGALEISNLISCGIGDIDVARPVSVAVISTGDELVDSFSNLSRGKIMNSNGPMLQELARKFSMTVTSEVSVTDEPSKLTAVIQQALREADMVVLSGGVSAGDFDFVPQAIEEAGLQIHFSRVAIKPGKPVTFATNENGILFGLPGNPVSVFLTFHLFVLHAAARLSGASYEPKTFNIRLANDYTRRSGERMVYVPCRITSDGFAEPVIYHGSAHLAALMQAEGFLIIPIGVRSMTSGAEVPLVMFGSRFG